MNKKKNSNYHVTGYDIQDNKLIIYYSDATFEIVDYSREKEIDTIEKMKYYISRYRKRINILSSYIGQQQKRIDDSIETRTSHSFIKDPEKYRLAMHNIELAENKRSSYVKKLLFIENERLINNEVKRQFDALSEEEKAGCEPNFMSIYDVNNISLEELKEMIELINSSSDLELKRA